MRRGTAALTLELIIALPDDPPVLVGGVPHLGAVEGTTVPADGTGAEHAAAAVLQPRFLRRFSSIYTGSHSWGGMMASWLCWIKYCGTSPSFGFIFFCKKSIVKDFCGGTSRFFMMIAVGAYKLHTAEYN